MLFKAWYLGEERCQGSLHRAKLMIAHEQEATTNNRLILCLAFVAIRVLFIITLITVLALVDHGVMPLPRRQTHLCGAARSL